MEVIKWMGQEDKRSYQGNRKSTLFKMAFMGL